MAGGNIKLTFFVQKYEELLYFLYWRCMFQATDESKDNCNLLFETAGIFFPYGGPPMEFLFHTSKISRKISTTHVR